MTYMISKFRLRTGCTALGPFSQGPNNSQKAHLYSILSSKKTPPPPPSQESVVTSAVTRWVSLSLSGVQDQDTHCCCTPNPRSPLTTLLQEGWGVCSFPTAQNSTGHRVGERGNLVNYFIFMRTKQSKMFSSKWAEILLFSFLEASVSVTSIWLKNKGNGRPQRKLFWGHILCSKCMLTTPIR